MSHSLWSFVVVSLCVSSSGCFAAAVRESRERYERERVAAEAAAAATMPRDLFVVAEKAWWCPTEGAARSSGACEGGKEFLRGAQVRVFGAGPRDGVWPSEIFDERGVRRGFVSAAGLADSPSTTLLDEATRQIEASVTAGQRIPDERMTYSDFVASPEIEGRKIVLRIPMRMLKDRKVEGGVLSFKLMFPAKAGLRLDAAVPFEFRNESWAQEYVTAAKKLSCGPDFCDEFVFVAKRVRLLEVTDAVGTVRKVPLFAIERLADRYGTYDGR
jgi:hypothetical protein